MDKLKKLAVEMRTYAEKLDDTEPNLASVFHGFTDSLDAFLQRSTPEQEEESEDDWDNEDYMRGWQDGKADSVDPRSKSPCPECTNGEAPIELDEDGTKSSVSGTPGRPGHGAGDAYWFCEDFSPPVEPTERQGEKPVAMAFLTVSQNQGELLTSVRESISNLAQDIMDNLPDGMHPLYLEPPPPKSQERDRRAMEKFTVEGLALVRNPDGFAYQAMHHLPGCFYKGKTAADAILSSEDEKR